ncbi:MAG TPA: LON peptidase substrate-binding domain-containing protein, partial [Candidatus Krumholzibacterium sp.]|nr:LON peptidase substrate-binding domain-containing protein [Candidatus Krumholzibacterium sp.]
RTEKDLAGRIRSELPVIPINDGVVFPYMLVPLILRDDNLIRLIDEAVENDKIVGVFTQIDPSMDMPGPGDLFTTGCAMVVQKMARFPDGHMRIIGQGLKRIGIRRFTDDVPFMRAEIELLEEPGEAGAVVTALMQNVAGAFARLVDKSEMYPDDLLEVLPGIDDPGRLADLLAANISMDVSGKQKALELIDPVARLQFIYENINNELEIAAIGEKIREDVHREMEREQRDYYLRQQIRAIQKELGEVDSAGELDELKDRIEEKVLPEHARDVLIKEWNKLSRMSTSSSEYGVAMNYIDWILDLPWEDQSHDTLDLAQARRILDEDHYDLEEVKERLLEFLAVKKLKEGGKGTIICLTGPPGVGKTSLGQSIARAMGRQFVRVSLGGIRDEAEIRGHRRTYVGSMPGRIIQGIRNAGRRNPVFMLDEIDKLGNDFRGDPSAALLEALDPQQ